MAPQLLTQKEVEARLALSASSVYRLITAGKLPRVRIGQRAVRFRQADVERLVADGVERNGSG